MFILKPLQTLLILITVYLSYVLIIDIATDLYIIGTLAE